MPIVKPTPQLPQDDNDPTAGKDQPGEKKDRQRNQRPHQRQRAVLFHLGRSPIGARTDKGGGEMKNQTDVDSTHAP